MERRTGAIKRQRTRAETRTIHWKQQWDKKASSNSNNPNTRVYHTGKPSTSDCSPQGIWDYTTAHTRKPGKHHHPPFPCHGVRWYGITPGSWPCPSCLLQKLTLFCLEPGHTPRKKTCALALHGHAAGCWLWLNNDISRAWFLLIIKLWGESGLKVWPQWVSQMHSGFAL